jgi:hypothetical protein
VTEHDFITSRGATPASLNASVATRTIRLSTVSLSSLPNGVWAQPTIQAVIGALLVTIRRD